MPPFRLKNIAVSACLVLVLVAVFWRLGQFDFIHYDDGTYVYENSHVVKGWSLEGLKWAFTTNLHLHWHPLTWLSLMTDSRFFGMDPGDFHLVSLLIHILNTILLFYVLNQMTGALYCSAFVAALFGLHPLHVEPVAWIADRKDVLSAFFWMVALWTYLRYIRKPGWRNIALVFVSFVCALMSKSMAVTLPLILLLLDYWPLNRIAGGKGGTVPEPQFRDAKPVRKSGKRGVKQNRKMQPPSGPVPGANIVRTTQSMVRLLLEKALLFIPMIVGAGITLVITQRKPSAPIDLARAIPSLNNLEGAAVSYAKYLYQMVWPTGLAIPYPEVKQFPLWDIFLSLCVLSVISLFAYLRRRQNPYLLVGWLWYLITLLPAIGLIRTGPHIQADRYTYIPLIGIFIMIAWGAADLVRTSANRKWFLGAGAAICLLACMNVSQAQVSLWKNSITLFSHSVSVTEDNNIAHSNLGLALLESRRPDEAMIHFAEAIRIWPEDIYAQVNLGNAYKYKNDLEKAAYQYEKAFSIDPRYVNASYNLAIVYLQMNKLDLSEKYFLKTIENDKRNHRAYLNLGATYSRMGRSAEAIANFRESINIQPEQHLAYYGLGLEYMGLNELEKAEINFNKVLEYKPDYERAYCDLGEIMVRRKAYGEAIRYLSKALEINPGYAKAGQLLAQAQMEQGNAAR